MLTSTAGVEGRVATGGVLGREGEGVRREAGMGILGVGRVVRVGVGWVRWVEGRVGAMGRVVVREGRLGMAGGGLRLAEMEGLGMETNGVEVGGEVPVTL